MKRTDEMEQVIDNAVSQAVSGRDGRIEGEIPETSLIPAEVLQDLRPGGPGSDNDTAKGPPDAGGLQAGTRNENCPAEAMGYSPPPKKTWQRRTAEWLAERITRDSLANLLGPFRGILERDRGALAGSVKPFTRQDQAEALVHRHGRDLLHDPKVRKAVAKSVGLSAPNKWPPGKPSAVTFVEEAGLPRELAGIAARPSQRNVELLQGRSPIRPMLEFQVEVKDKLAPVLGDRIGRAILTLPCGGGKTLVGIECFID